MKSFLFFLSILTLSQGAVTDIRNHISYDHGIITAYATNWTGGHCGFSSFPSPVAEKYFIAISMQDEEGWQDGLNCGACVRLTYTDGKSFVGMVSDSCGGCHKYHWDISNQFYLDLTSNAPFGPERISKAEVLECPDNIVTGNLRVKTKDGSDAFWAAFQVTNIRIPINGMSISVDKGVTWHHMAGPPQNHPHPSGMWFVKPRHLILNDQNGMEYYKIRVESNTGNIVVDMAGVYDGEVEAHTNNGMGQSRSGLLNQTTTNTSAVPTTTNTSAAIPTTTTTTIATTAATTTSIRSQESEVSNQQSRLHTSVPK